MIKELNKIIFEGFDDYIVAAAPKNRRMKILSDMQIKGMTTENIDFIRNEVVRIFAEKGCYLEVGCFQGRSLISAALFNKNTRCIGVDNFSLFDKSKKNYNILTQNIEKSKCKNIEFYNDDYLAAIPKIFSKEPNLKIDVYFYDGNHTYEEQLQGLEIILPYLADRCIILVDDVNWKIVDEANHKFLEKYLNFHNFLKLRTSNNHKQATTSPWWNGFQIIYRDSYS